MVEPLFEPGIKETDASALPAEAATEVGTSGMVYGVSEITFEGVEVPTAFCARISKSYGWPFVREVAESVSVEGDVVAYSAKVLDPVKRS